ncbi:hypothetical protein QYF61_017295 [Mycteria americana]|uniref:Uncharacterized protein n=1 Tax=Mycteria americana TaxID=33587 RepID=A0AAN7RX72_MYCAM|nr:hypothetical protein QYF61_017295 [Mycteria americana]
MSAVSSSSGTSHSFTRQL